MGLSTGGAIFGPGVDEKDTIGDDWKNEWNLQVSPFFFFPGKVVYNLSRKIVNAEKLNNKGMNASR